MKNKKNLLLLLSILIFASANLFQIFQHQNTIFKDNLSNEKTLWITIITALFVTVISWSIFMFIFRCLINIKNTGFETQLLDTIFVWCIFIKAVSQFFILETYSMIYLSLLSVVLMISSVIFFKKKTKSSFFSKKIIWRKMLLLVAILFL